MSHQLGRIKAKRFKNARPERFYKYIGVGQDDFQKRNATRGLEIKGDGGLVARQQIWCSRRWFGCVCGRVRTVDAEDGGSIIGEEERRKRN